MRGVADYRRCLRSQALGSEERQAIEPSVVSSWHLNSGRYPASWSRLAEGKDTTMDIDSCVSTAKLTPPEAHRDTNTRRMGVRDWVADQQALRSQEPALEEPEPLRQRAPLPTAHNDARRSAAQATHQAPPRTAGE